MEAIQKYGTMIKSPSGYPTQSPYLAIANRQAEIMMRISAEFEFTPESRVDLQAKQNLAIRDLLPLGSTWSPELQYGAGGRRRPARHRFAR